MGYFGYSKAGVLWDVVASLAPLAFVGCESGLGVPVTQLVVLDVGGRLPQGLRSVLACSVWMDRPADKSAGYVYEAHLRGLPGRRLRFMAEQVSAQERFNCFRT